MTDLEMVKSKYWRQVSPRRARKLQKRGEFVIWSSDLNGYIWDPYWQAPNPKTENGLPWVDYSNYRHLTEGGESERRRH